MEAWVSTTQALLLFGERVGVTAVFIDGGYLDKVPLQKKAHAMRAAIGLRVNSPSCRGSRCGSGVSCAEA